MAEAMVDRLFQESERELEEENEAQQTFLTLLIASTTFEEDEWSEWLGDKLYRLALIVPQKHLKHLGTLIDELKMLLPISQWRFGQVEALCHIQG